MTATARARYHHGDARAALLDAVEEIVRSKGIDAVTISGAAAAIGVSHAAAFRHFADKRALLTAFATRCAGELAAFMEREAAGVRDAHATFHLIGVGYIRFAVERPGAFRALFRNALLDVADSDYNAAMARLEALLLSGAVRSEKEEEDGLPPSALLAWAATHGLATLSADGALDNLPPATRSIEGLANALTLLKKALT